MWWWIYFLLLFIPITLSQTNFTNCIKTSIFCQCAPRIYFTHTTRPCYQELFDNETAKHCCNNFSSFCPVTRLLTAHSPIRIEKPRIIDYFSFSWTNKTDKEEFYQDPVSKNACPIPYSYLTFRFLKALPVDFSFTRTTPMIRCETHSDCPVGTYCGFSVNPSFVPSDQSKELRREQMDRTEYENKKYGISFCYENFLKSDKFELVILPNEKGISVCTKVFQCAKDEYCYLWHASEKLFLEEVYSPTHYRGFSSYSRPGVCVHANICEPPMRQGRRHKRKDVCKTESECEDIGDIYDIKCVKFKHDFLPLEDSLCCYNPKKCSFGVVKSPLQKCNTTKDCNLLPDGKASTALWTKWCDDKGYCCHDPNNITDGLCPDGIIYAFQEEKCESVTEANITSETCTSQPDAICRYGHCCSGLEIKNGKTTLANSYYVTNVDCDPMEEVQEKFHFAFCNETKITIIGFLDVHGDEFNRDERNINCQINENCTEIGLKYCVRESNTDLYCYRDPYTKIHKNSNDVNWHLVIFIVVSVFVGICILLCVLKRSKCRKRNTRTIRNKKLRLIGTTKTTKSLESKTQ